MGGSLVKYLAKFRDLAIDSTFIDDDGDICRKVDPGNAKTPYCAPGFNVGFRHNEDVMPVPRCYRLKQAERWLIIGASDDCDALRIARRTDFTAKPSGLQIWDGMEFVACTDADSSKSREPFVNAPLREVNRLVREYNSELIDTGMTDPNDWTVSIRERKPCPWEPRAELISCTFSYRGSDAEALTDVPMDTGITEDELKLWLAQDTEQFAQSESARAMQEGPMG